VTALAGDTEARHLGLSDEDWAYATRATTHAVHSAALVKMTLPLEAARRSAVSAAQNIVEFAAAARAHRFEKLELVSTVGVNGRRSEPLGEDWLEAPREFHNTYEAAKAEAEMVAKRASDGGLPLTVVRPSMVVGDSKTGKVIAAQIFTYISRFLTGVALGGIFPPLERARLDVVPVDWVSALILASSRTPQWAGKVLHACSGDSSVPLEVLRGHVQRVAAANGSKALYRATLPLFAFRQAMRVLRIFGGERGRKSAQLLGILWSYLEDEQRFENQNTKALAASAGVPFIEPAAYLQPVLEQVFSKIK
jgi:thioester reductase-like protein